MNSMSGYDSPSRQQLENQINDYIQVGHTLNVELLLANIGDAKFYKDMSEDFLNHIRWLTGTVNGIVITDEDIRFLVSCRRHDIGYAIVSFSVVFGKDGKYRKIGDIICINDMTGKDTDRPLYARSQVKSALDAFLDRGVNLYYLKEPVIEPVSKSHSFSQSAGCSISAGYSSPAYSTTGQNACASSVFSPYKSNTFSTSTSGNEYVT